MKLLFSKDKNLYFFIFRDVLEVIMPEWWKYWFI